MQGHAGFYIACVSLPKDGVFDTGEPKRIQTETPRRKRDAELNELRAVGRDSEQIVDIDPLRGMETLAE